VLHALLSGRFPAIIRKKRLWKRFVFGLGNFFGTPLGCVWGVLDRSGKALVFEEEKGWNVPNVS